MIADQTNSVKLVVWEELIDKLKAGDSYHLKNLTVRIFGDEKYLTTNENTAVETIEQMQDVNLEAEDIQDNIYTAVCIGVIVAKDSCFICNHTIEELPEKGDSYNCANCHNTLLKRTKKTKVVCTLTMQMGDNKLTTFTCFNDAVKSFLTTINKGDQDVADISPEVLNGLFLNSGKINFICDTATKVIDQFIL